MLTPKHGWIHLTQNRADPVRAASSILDTVSRSAQHKRCDCLAADRNPRAWSLVEGLYASFWDNHLVQQAVAASGLTLLAAATLESLVSVTPI